MKPISKVIVPALPEVRICVISGYRRLVDENCALLGYYAASGGNSLQMFRYNLSAPR